MNRSHTIARTGIAPRPRNEESPGALKRFLELFNSVTAIATVVATLTGALFFARDYFATKSELNILKCRMEAGQSVVEIQQQLKDIYSREADLKLMESNGTTDTLHSAEIMRLEKESAALQTRSDRFVEQLKGAACQQQTKEPS